MEAFLSLRCKDVQVLVNDGRRVLVNFITEDNEDCFCSIFPNILKAYPNVKFTKEFIERVICKMKISLHFNSKEINFLNEGKFLRLVTSLQDIYDVITILPSSSMTLDNPLKIKCNCVDIYKDSCKFFMITKLEKDICNFKNVVVRVDSEIFDVFKNYMLKESIRKNEKKYNRDNVADFLSDYLKNKEIELEYNEHKGFTLWTALDLLLE